MPSKHQVGGSIPLGIAIFQRVYSGHDLSLGAQMLRILRQYCCLFTNECPHNGGLERDRIKKDILFDICPMSFINKERGCFDQKEAEAKISEPRQTKQDYSGNATP